LVKKAHEKLAKTINLENSEQGSLKDMQVKRGPKSFRRNY